MKKNEIFTFTAPNGFEVIGVVVNLLNSSIEEGSCDYYELRTWLCYAKIPYADCAKTQLFTYMEAYGSKWPDEPEETLWAKFDKVLVDLAVLPEYDDMLEEVYLNKHEEETL
jgi:hypothetical protein